MDILIVIFASKDSILPSIGLSVINNAAYQAALIDIQHIDDDLQVVQHNQDPEKYVEEEEDRVEIMGTGIKI